MEKKMSRSPYDGKPYYCTECGLGWNEYGACEEIGCKLESVEDAQDRQAGHAALAEMKQTETRKPLR